jgi:hypothetical protein
MKSDRKIPETLTKIAKPERPATLNLVSTIELKGVHEEALCGMGKWGRVGCREERLVDGVG